MSHHHVKRFSLAALACCLCHSLICPHLVDDQQPEVKAEQAPVSVKKEPPIVAETRVLDGAATSGKKKNAAKKQKTETGIDDTMAENFFFLTSMEGTCCLIIKNFFSLKNRRGPCSA